MRNKVCIYGWVNTERPEALAEATRKRMADGFTAIKFNAVEKMEWIDSPRKVKEAGAKMAAIREAGGDDLLIGVDLYGRVYKGLAGVVTPTVIGYLVEDGDFSPAMFFIGGMAFSGFCSDLFLVGKIERVEEPLP